MNKLGRHVLFLSSCAALFSTAFAQELFNKDGFFSSPQPVKFEIFQRTEPTQTIGGYPLIPLGNDLSLVRLKVTSSSLGTPLGHAYFFDIRNDKFFASVDVEANLESGRGGDWTDEPCKRTNFLWKRSTGGAFKNINCASINHSIKFWVNPTGEFQQLLVNVREKGLEIAPTVIQIIFTTYADQSRRVIYKISLNPEIFGFERDTEPVWGANSWYKDFSSKDPKKSEFISKLSEWATLVQDRMPLVLVKEKNAFSGIPALEEFIKGAKTNITSESSSVRTAPNPVVRLSD